MITAIIIYVAITLLVFILGARKSKTSNLSLSRRIFFVWPVSYVIIAIMLPWVVTKTIFQSFK